MVTLQAWKGLSKQKYYLQPQDIYYEHNECVLAYILQGIFKLYVENIKRKMISNSLGMFL